MEVADPGDTIELSWHTKNAGTNTLYNLLPSGQFGAWWEVATTDKVTFTISAGARNRERFVLFVANEESPLSSATVIITLTCPDDWFFTPAPDICLKDAPLISRGAEQAFEQGVMVGVEENDSILAAVGAKVGSAWLPPQPMNGHSLNITSSSRTGSW